MISLASIALLFKFRNVDPDFRTIAAICCQLYEPSCSIPDSAVKEDENGAGAQSTEGRV
jgi:hypothetical protein